MAKTSNERELWSGVPRRGIVFRSADALIVPFSILWTWFAVSWEVTVMKTDAPILFELWGLPFVLIGLYFVIGRFFVDAWRRSRTTYQLTSDRVVITIGQTIRSLDLRALGDVTYSERADGSGTITFGPGSVMPMMNSTMPWPRIAMPPALEVIPDVRRVFALIRDAQQAAL